VRDSDFLDAKKHPEIVFEATGFEPGAERDGRLEGKLAGRLTLLGQTHPVVLDVTLNKAATYPFGHRKHTLGISARTTIERSRWGMDYGISRGMVGDAVELRFELEAMRDD
jgi:polyisoprenoid-binding protein YceI